MELLIVLVREHPPVGEVRVIGGPDGGRPDCEPTGFSGWLGLIGVLETLLKEGAGGGPVTGPDRLK